MRVSVDLRRALVLCPLAEMGAHFDVQRQRTIACSATAMAHAARSPQASAACGDATASVKE
ncbi:hypothetical protein XFF6992_460078 [Xanthomonas citri pv. fuscans]|nr:hypothetical protein XFF6992_460078 [Xanthomonas citri pv. fuscans]SOO34668.1 hypothetical protein XFF6994_4470005 [Xanthomonas citri pv. fuscans]